MTEIRAALVKTLRDRTGAGVIACKNALAETDGDLEAAVDRLRASEAMHAEKTADRVAAEGLVGLVVDSSNLSRGSRGAIIELNAETDFVARTEVFRDAVAALAAVALEANADHGGLLNAPIHAGQGSVSDFIAHLGARTGERISLRRSAVLTVGRGVVGSYTHGTLAPGLGRIGVLVALESEGNGETLLDVGHKIAMHVAASAPLWITPEHIPPSVVADRRLQLAARAQQAGKAPAIAEKMVDGRMRKFLEEVALTLQPFALDPDRRVHQFLADAERAAGAAIVVTAFCRFKAGDGLKTAAA